LSSSTIRHPPSRQSLLEARSLLAAWIMISISFVQRGFASIVDSPILRTTRCGETSDAQKRLGSKLKIEEDGEMFQRRAVLCTLAAAPWILKTNSRHLLAQDTAAPSRSEDTYTQAQWQEVVDRAVAFLRAQGRDDQGAYSSTNGLGVTALVVAGLSSVGVPASDPAAAKSIDYLMQYELRNLFGHDGACPLQR
jgi:hypothetical protein